MMEPRFNEVPGITNDIFKIGQSYSKMLGGGCRGREIGRKGGGRCTGGGRREGEERDSQGGGKREKREKLRNIAQYFVIEKRERGGSQQIQDGKREV